MSACQRHNRRPRFEENDAKIWKFRREDNRFVVRVSDPGDVHGCARPEADVAEGIERLPASGRWEAALVDADAMCARTRALCSLQTASHRPYR